MANDEQFKPRTSHIGTRGVKEYRDSVTKWVQPHGTVLEIGCEWGTTTALIAPKCKHVVGTDISPGCMARARQRHPDIQFEALDALYVLAAQRLGWSFTKVYIDTSGISGYRSLLDLISLLTMYAMVLRPQAFVVKNGALKRFASHCFAWRLDDADHHIDGQPDDAADHAAPQRAAWLTPVPP